jgi:hypothetical protein
MPFIALLIAGLCAPGSACFAPSAAAKPSVRVYVFAAAVPGAPKDEDEGRAEAVSDMRDALGRKAGLELVNSRAEADVFVEVLGREQRKGMEGGFGGAAVTKMGQTIIRLHVTSGDEEVELKGIGQGTWGRAAKDAADRVLKWIARLERKKTVGGPTNAAPTAPHRR